MRPEQVPDAWVETAARAQYRHKGGSPDDSVDLPWESLPESHRAEWRRQARHGLAAVLPDLAQGVRNLGRAMREADGWDEEWSTREVRDALNIAADAIDQGQEGGA